MSDISSYDYGLAEASAIRRRKQQSIANQQAATLGQKRGARNLETIQTNYRQGLPQQVAAYGRRGFGDAGVSSGIRVAGLESYAKKLQQDLGTESENTQDLLNQISLQEAGQQADLEDYLAQLRLQKQQQVLASAMDIKRYSAF